MRPDKNAEGADALEPTEFQQHPQYASTLANGLAVLGCFAGGALVLGNKDIAEQLSMSRPTVSRLTFTLVGLGYLRRDPSTSKYSLGPAVLSLGYPLLSRLMIRQMGAELMLKLSDYAQGPVSVGTRDRMQVVYVETIHSRQSSETRPGIGSTRPLLRTAIGRAILYGLPQVEREAVLKQLRRNGPADWETYGKDLEASFEDIKRDGFCVVRGAWRSTLAAVAVPMRKPVSGMHLAFNLTVPAFSTTDEALRQDLGPRLLGLVHNIEDMLGQA